MNIITIGDRVRLNANGSFTMPRIIRITDDEIVLQRRKKGRKIGTLTVSKYRLEILDKSFRTANYSCTIRSRI